MPLKEVEHWHPGPGERTAGSGRKPGTPNKLTLTVRDALKEAFHRVGGTDALVKLHATNPEAFFALVGKLIPTEIVADVNVNMQFTAILIEAQQRRIADALG